MNIKKNFNQMSYKDRLSHLCGGRVTVGSITQVTDDGLKTFYVAKIRGIIIKGKYNFRHDTPESARKYGNATLLNWKNELEQIRKRASVVSAPPN